MRRRDLLKGSAAVGSATVLGFAAAGAEQQSAQSQTPPAHDASFDPSRWMDDLAIVNARVITLEPPLPFAQALLVRRGRIVAIGSNTEIRRAAAGARIFDAADRCVVPGFVDTHVHIDWSSAGQTLMVDLHSAKTIPDILQRMRAAASDTPPGKWVLGLGKDIEGGQVAERRLPTIDELDAITQQHPLLVFGNVHSLSANSLGAKALGYLTYEDEANARWWSNREPFASGVVRRDEKGRPGTVYEWTFQRLPETLFSVEELKGAIRQTVIEMFVAGGTTSVCDMAIVGNPVHTAQQELHASGELPLRIRAYYVCPHNLSVQSVVEGGLTRGFGNDMFRIGGVKFFYTGAHVNRHWSYNHTEDEHLQQLTLLHARGFQTFNHAVGQPGREQVVRVVERLKQRFPRPVIHHRLEHSAPPLELARRAVAADMRFAVTGMRRRSELAYPTAPNNVPFRSYVQEGMKPVIISDQCDAPPLFEPLYAIASACNSNDEGGAALPGEAVRFDDALRMLTIWAAESSHQDHDRGSIAVGKLGDLAVLSADPRGLPGSKLYDLKVTATILGGKVVHGA